MALQNAKAPFARHPRPRSGCQDSYPRQTTDGHWRISTNIYPRNHVRVVTPSIMNCYDLLMFCHHSIGKLLLFITFLFFAGVLPPCCRNHWKMRARVRTKHLPNRVPERPPQFPQSHDPDGFRSFLGREASANMASRFPYSLQWIHRRKKPQIPVVLGEVSQFYKMVQSFAAHQHGQEVMPISTGIFQNTAWFFSGFPY